MNIAEMQTYSTRQVAKRVGLSLSRLRAVMASPDCPRPEQKIGQSFVWFDDDIARLKSWLDARPERRGRPRKDDEPGGEESADNTGDE